MSSSKYVQKISNIERYPSGITYFNISIQNGPANNAIPAAYSETKISNIVDKADDYFLGIARFSCPSTNIPDFIPDVVLGQTDVNKTIYTFTISYDGNDSPPENVIYTPVSTVAPIPNPPIVKQDVNQYSTYYHIHYIQEFITQCNTAIAAAFSKISTPVGSTPPWFEYDSVTQLVSLVAQQAYYDISSVAKPITLSSNFSTYRTITKGLGLESFNGINNTKCATYLITDNKNNWYQPSQFTQPTVIAPAAPLPPQYLKMQSEYKIFDIISPLQSIVFASGLLPTKGEYIQPPQSYGTPGNNVNTGIAASQKILTDFQPDMYNIDESRNVIQYSVTGIGNLRLVELTSPIALTEFDLNVYWLDKYNNLNLIALTGSQALSIKIALVPKNQVINFLNK